MNGKFHSLIINIIFLGLCGCGVAGLGSVDGNIIGNSDNLKIIMSGSSNDGVHPLMKINEYQMLFHKSDGNIDERVIAYNSSIAHLKDLPSGSYKMIEVLGKNIRGDTVRYARAGSLSVSKGQQNSISLQLNPVPIFANIRNNAVEFNTRFRPVIVGFPNETLSVWHKKSDDAELSALLDVVSNSNEPQLTSDKATYDYSPKMLDVGEYDLVVEDRITGLQTNVQIRLLDGSKIRPAPVNGAGAVTASSLESKVGGL